MTQRDKLINDLQAFLEYKKEEGFQALEISAETRAKLAPLKPAPPAKPAAQPAAPRRAAPCAKPNLPAPRLQAV